MPPKMKITKEAILHAAVELVRQKGVESLNARSLAQELKCSTQPIFSNYTGMEQLRSDVLDYAACLYQEYIQKEMRSAQYPDYKSYGMAYIRFAKEERELFKLLFMRSRTQEENQNEDENISDVIAIIQKSTGLSCELARLFHLEMWIFVHGAASLMVSSYSDWDWELISNMLSDVFAGLKTRFEQKE